MNIARKAWEDRLKAVWVAYAVAGSQAADLMREFPMSPERLPGTVLALVGGMLVLLMLKHVYHRPDEDLSGLLLFAFGAFLFNFTGAVKVRDGVAAIFHLFLSLVLFRIIWINADTNAVRTRKLIQLVFEATYCSIVAGALGCVFAMAGKWYEAIDRGVLFYATTASSMSALIARVLAGPADGRRPWVFIPLALASAIGMAALAFFSGSGQLEDHWHIQAAVDPRGISAALGAVMTFVLPIPLALGWVVITRRHLRAVTAYGLLSLVGIVCGATFASVVVMSRTQIDSSAFERWPHFVSEVAAGLIAGVALGAAYGNRDLYGEPRIRLPHDA